MGSDVAPDPRALVALLQETASSAPPGQHFHYSDAGYQALGLILEAVLRTEYAALVQDGVLTPLGMQDTEPIIRRATRQRLAVGYASLYDDRPHHRDYPSVPAPWFEWNGGDSSVVSTAADMAVYLRMLLNDGQVPSQRVLSAESFALLTRPAVPAAQLGEGTFYGYGLFTQEVEEHTNLFHGGGMPGYQAMLMADLDAGVGVVVMINGPGAATEVAHFALQMLRAVGTGRDLPAVPPPSDPLSVANAAEFAGTYIGPQGQVLLSAADDRLQLHHEGEVIPLEPQGPDMFYTPTPSWALFPWRFNRADGGVIEACHGPFWYTKAGLVAPAAPPAEPSWEAYTGHYRAHNPWHSNFRVVLRKSTLFLVEPSGEEECLVEVAPGCFRVGAEDYLPERLCFDTLVAGKTLRATLSGCPYYRFFTP
jgi:hypothetical protein